jgi:hypothetical protein
MPNWCWAAVATSIFKFYRPQSIITQPKFVSDFLRIPQCNSSQPLPTCNRQASLSDALHMLNIFNGRVENPIHPEAVARELSNRKPISCLLFHPEFSGHFVVISGLFKDPNDPGRISLRVEDPLDGMERIVGYPDLVRGFRNSHWVKTYFTRPLIIP